MKTILLITLLSTSFLQAQKVFIEGDVINKDTQSPLIGAILFWEGTDNGSITNEKGYFKITTDSSSRVLVVSYVGYQTQKLLITQEKQIIISLAAKNEVDIIEIKINKPTTRIDFYKTINLEEISEKGLAKAACCNLSESFETNPTVDASFSDAVTGTKQIQLLGLAGPYALMTTGNIPTIKGNSAVTGLDFIPGQWLSSIQLIKGTGSVVNGNQSIAGQINAEYKDFENNEKLFVNLFRNSATRTELNVIKGLPITKSIHSALFLQADNTYSAIDNNKDGFMDNHLGPKIVAMNTWAYKSDSSNWQLKAGLKVDYSDKEAGQLPEVKNRYLFKNNQKKVEVWAKIGFVSEKKGRSTGLQVLGYSDDKDLVFGNSTLTANENHVFANWIYSDIIYSSFHTIKTGLNYAYKDMFNSFSTLHYGWENHLIGAFFEYVYKPSKNFSLISGVRYDYNSNWKNVTTPRLHGRWEITTKDVLRFSGGLGTKEPNPFMENIGVFASSRNLILDSSFVQEQAWNYGINYTRKFTIKNTPVSFSTDFYRTDFIHKQLVNFDISSKEIWFYNIQNGSYSNSFMAQLITQPYKNMELNIAYRNYNLQTKFNTNSFQQNPLTPVNRIFVNTNIEILKNWDWDFTVSWNGESRIPNTAQNEVEWQLKSSSDPFLVANSQIKFEPRNTWSFYLGSENLFNYQQPNPILDAKNPFQENFDASLIWGPIFGRRVYGGFKLQF